MRKILTYKEFIRKIEKTKNNDDENLKILTSEPTEGIIRITGITEEEIKIVVDDQPAVVLRNQVSNQTPK